MVYFCYENHRFEKKYKNKWLLVKIIKENRINQILEAKPLLVSDERQKIYEYLTKVKKGSHVATIYTGEAPKKGLVFTFYVKLKI